MNEQPNSAEEVRRLRAAIGAIHYHAARHGYPGITSRRALVAFARAAVDECENAVPELARLRSRAAERAGA